MPTSRFSQKVSGHLSRDKWVMKLISNSFIIFLKQNSTQLQSSSVHTCSSFVSNPQQKNFFTSVVCYVLQTRK